MPTGLTRNLTALHRADATPWGDRGESRNGGGELSAKKMRRDESVEYSSDHIAAGTHADADHAMRRTAERASDGWMHAALPESELQLAEMLHAQVANPTFHTIEGRDRLGLHAAEKFIGKRLDQSPVLTTRNLDERAQLGAALLRAYRYGEVHFPIRGATENQNFVVRLERFAERLTRTAGVSVDRQSQLCRELRSLHPNSRKYTIPTQNLELLAAAAINAAHMPPLSVQNRSAVPEKIVFRVYSGAHSMQSRLNPSLTRARSTIERSASSNPPVSETAGSAAAAPRTLNYPLGTVNNRASSSADSSADRIVANGAKIEQSHPNGRVDAALLPTTPPFSSADIGVLRAFLERCEAMCASASANGSGTAPRHRSEI